MLVQYRGCITIPWYMVQGEHNCKRYTQEGTNQCSVYIRHTTTYTHTHTEFVRTLEMWFQWVAVLLQRGPSGPNVGGCRCPTQGWSSTS